MRSLRRWFVRVQRDRRSEYFPQHNSLTHRMGRRAAKARNAGAAWSLSWTGVGHRFDVPEAFVNASVNPFRGIFDTRCDKMQALLGGSLVRAAGLLYDGLYVP